MGAGSSVATSRQSDSVYCGDFKPSSKPVPTIDLDASKFTTMRNPLISMNGNEYTPFAVRVILCWYRRVVAEAEATQQLEDEEEHDEKDGESDLRLSTTRQFAKSRHFPILPLEIQNLIAHFCPTAEELIPKDCGSLRRALRGFKWTGATEFMKMYHVLDECSLLELSLLVEIIIDRFDAAAKSKQFDDAQQRDDFYRKHGSTLDLAQNKDSFGVAPFSGIHFFKAVFTHASQSQSQLCRLKLAEDSSVSSFMPTEVERSVYNSSTLPLPLSTAQTSLSASKGHLHLSSLWLDKNGLDCDRLSAIVSALRQWEGRRYLRTLNLNGNPLGGDGLLMLATHVLATGDFQCLSQLFVSNTAADDASVIQTCKVLAATRLPTTLRLVLNCNKQIMKTSVFAFEHLVLTTAISNSEMSRGSMLLVSLRECGISERFGHWFWSDRRKRMREKTRDELHTPFWRLSKAIQF